MGLDVIHIVVKERSIDDDGASLRDERYQQPAIVRLWTVDGELLSEGRGLTNSSACLSDVLTEELSRTLDIRTIDSFQQRVAIAEVELTVKMTKSAIVVGRSLTTLEAFGVEEGEDVEEP